MSTCCVCFSVSPACVGRRHQPHATSPPHSPSTTAECSSAIWACLHGPRGEYKVILEVGGGGGGGGGGKGEGYPVKGFIMKQSAWDTDCQSFELNNK